ncbi:glycosyltransferase [Ramlibacter tataouinensis]|uniref:Candidate zeaxanthin b-glucosyltransferase, Glycosyltransferase Family 1 n=1 Tax=Ramlibacter tataouinensis (strain ATCC BAA-407 / DSM 14655 / LMG 21543 / TTB310) TaxID=365046 RepID=F5XXQ1_RAMTT|nr:glycosyltransferase [Ramlibacter tataouinensis]AEG91854.1 candidate zeaxanthin b-glucosyltransferase, Glycosyltransferase Family 1 [Ramlibacter tataouinensis TTB310]
MRHFAVLAPPFLSHVRALEALCGELLARGHRVSWLHQGEARALLQDPRIRFRALGRQTHPPGSLQRVIERAARPGGPLGLARVIADVAAATDMLCSEAPAALRDLGVDAVIADEMEAAGGLVAEAMGLPFVSVACALPVNREARLPLPVMPWGWARDLAGERLNEGSARVYDWLMRPHARVIARHARGFGLRPRETLAECLSPLAQISQTTASFDFPREAAPPQLHHVGPLRAPTRRPQRLSFPPQRQPKADVPFVFASLGTLQGGRFGLFRRIAQACRDEGVQLLLAHCDRLGMRQAQALERSGATWVTGFAPQQAALERADVVVTHAGLNTVMDALAAGTPMLALPVAFDQPGVAARVVHAGAGCKLLPLLASRSALRESLRQLLDDPGYAARARALGADVRAAGGVTRAADIVEQASRTGRPVLRSGEPARSGTPVPAPTLMPQRA